jgi:hypothetical protein
MELVKQNMFQDIMSLCKRLIFATVIFGGDAGDDDDCHSEQKCYCLGSLEEIIKIEVEEVATRGLHI